MKRTDKNPLPALIEKMRARGLPRIAIETFSRYYEQIVSGETGLIKDADIRPVSPLEIEQFKTLEAFAPYGKKVFTKAVRIVLNGGLGTSMGLSGPKSLLLVKDGLSFLEILFKQVEYQKCRLALMNSFNTDRETRRAIAAMASPVQPFIFLQHQFPKILKETLEGAFWPENPALEWNPPGHGNVYTALWASGMLDELLKDGIEYAFISNSDNLGAVLDPSLLGFFAKKALPFMMEVAERTPADIKGGHLAKRKDGRFILREAAQCPESELAAFRDIQYYRYFNTNNIWINLRFLKDFMKKERVLLLPLILNEKSLDPRDDQSPRVFQVESAMGAAISLFQGAAAVCVPKSRMVPVKKCSDLLHVRSDRYLLSEDARLVANPSCKTKTLTLDLDSRYFGKIDDFESRFESGVPSLLECECLKILGDVRFEKDVKIVGRVRIENQQSRQAVVKSGRVVNQDLIF